MTTVRFRQARPAEADDIARLMNASRYFPRTSARDFLEALSRPRDPLQAFFAENADRTRLAQVQYYIHPYAGHTAWVGWWPDDDGALLEECLDFLDSLHLPPFGIYVADKFPRLIEGLTLRGFQQKNESICQLLALKDFRPEAAEARMAALRIEGYDFVTLDSLQNRRALYDLEVAVSVDVPNFPLSHQPSYEDFLQRMETDQRHHRFSVVVMKDDVAVAVAQHCQRQEGYFASTGTGVRRAARGRGLAMAAKLAGLRQIQEAGGAFVETCNDVSNTAMLSINKKIGYLPLGSQFFFVR